MDAAAYSMDNWDFSSSTSAWKKTDNLKKGNAAKGTPQAFKKAPKPTPESQPAAKGQRPERAQPSRSVKGKPVAKKRRLALSSSESEFESDAD